jgi:hypothetical protein
MKMPSLFFKFFKPVIREEKRKPKPGEIWFSFSDGSPWPKKGHDVTILDVKDDWVRYKTGPTFNDERMRMRSFLYIYEFYKDAEEN